VANPVWTDSGYHWPKLNPNRDSLVLSACERPEGFRCYNQANMSKKMMVA